MLTLYRRHTEKCRKKRAIAPNELQNCECPLWVNGNDRKGAFLRHSLATRDLFTATDRVRKIESGELTTAPASSDLTIPEAWAKYASILQSQRDIKASTLHRN